MKCNFIHIKLKDKSKISLNDNKVLDLLKLSFGNNITNLNYHKNKEDISNQNLRFNCYKKNIQKNIGKMLYRSIENKNETKIFNVKFISTNIKRAKIIINNKQYDLKENIENKKQIFKN